MSIVVGQAISFLVALFYCSTVRQSHEGSLSNTCVLSRSHEYRKGPRMLLHDEEHCVRGKRHAERLSLTRLFPLGQSQVPLACIAMEGPCLEKHG